MSVGWRCSSPALASCAPWRLFLSPWRMSETDISSNALCRTRSASSILISCRPANPSRESGPDRPSLQSLDVSFATLLVLCMVSSTSWSRPLFLPLRARPPAILMERCHSVYPDPRPKYWPFSPRHLDSLQSRCSEFPSSLSSDRATDNPQAF